MVNEQSKFLTTEQLSRTSAWRALSPVIQQILSILFAREDGDLGAAINQVHTEFSAEKSRAVGESVLADRDVQMVLLIRSGVVGCGDPTAGSPLEDLWRHEEFLSIEPLNVKLHPDNRFDSGENVDVQRVLRLYFGAAREDLKAALRMYRPDWDQPSVALVSKALYELEAFRRVLALRRGAK
jgi:hypothetical protein